MKILLAHTQHVCMYLATTVQMWMSELYRREYILQNVCNTCKYSARILNNTVAMPQLCTRKHHEPTYLQFWKHEIFWLSEEKK